MEELHTNHRPAHVRKAAQQKGMDGCTVALIHAFKGWTAAEPNGRPTLIVEQGDLLTHQAEVGGQALH